MNPDQTIHLNHNTAECLKSAIHFGSTTYYNICANTSNNVPWGAMDWMGWIFVSTILAVMAVGILLFLVWIAFEIVTG